MSVMLYPISPTNLFRLPRSDWTSSLPLALSYIVSFIKARHPEIQTRGQAEQTDEFDQVFL